MEIVLMFPIICYNSLDTSKMSTQYCSTINTQKKDNIMATLFFTPRTTIDANVFQNRLDNSPYHGEWNVRTGAYEFEIEEWEADELEENLSQELTYDINGRFEFQN